MALVTLENGTERLEVDFRGNRHLSDPKLHRLIAGVASLSGVARVQWTRNTPPIDGVQYRIQTTQKDGRVVEHRFRNIGGPDPEFVLVFVPGEFWTDREVRELNKLKDDLLELHKDVGFDSLIWTAK